MGMLKTLTINGTTYKVAPVVPADSVTLLASAWEGGEGAYSQIVEVLGVTANTKVDFQITPEQLAEFYDKDLAFTAENDGGVITVYSIGDKPAGDHTVQITKTEVDGTGKIRGNTVGTTLRPGKALVKATNLTTEEKALARTNIGAASQESVSAIEQQLADLNPLTISSFTAKDTATGKSTFEIGSPAITSVTFAWTFNKTPKTVTFNGGAMPIDSKGTTLAVNVTSTTSWPLVVTDERDAQAKGSAGIKFLNGVYYGALDAGATINKDAINGMSKSLQSGITGTFKMTATAGQKLTFAAPVSYGEPTKFTSGGLDYTWDKVATFEHENQSGHKENYNVWQNSEVTVGTFSITVVK